jgi:hypothetical protein
MLAYNTRISVQRYKKKYNYANKINNNFSFTLFTQPQFNLNNFIQTISV